MPPVVVVQTLEKCPAVDVNVLMNEPLLPDSKLSNRRTVGPVAPNPDPVIVTVPLLLIVPVAPDMTGAALAVGEKEIRAMLDEAVARIERKEDLITLMNGFFIETP